MSASNSTAIRDAIFARLAPLVPTGFSKWGLARVVSAPTVNATMLPALQIVLLKETYTPDGDENVGPPRFIVDATIGISVMRGMTDPAVLDGQADNDMRRFLDTLLHDGTFVNSDSATDSDDVPSSGDPVFWFESIPRIESDRRMVQQQAEGYMLELVLRITFRSREFWDALAPNMLDTVRVDVPTLTIQHAGDVWPSGEYTEADFSSGDFSSGD